MISRIAALYVAVTILFAAGAAFGAPVVSNVAPLKADVPKYDIFTLTFDLQTVAENYYWPYDAAPPPSIPAGTGVTVEGLFSNDGWATTLTVPGFYYQDYQRYIVDGREVVYPVGSPKWMIRFAPTVVGQWKYKIKVTDASGSVTYPATGDNTFTCTSSSNKGFVRPSATDVRYFEYDDGSPLLAVGTNAHVKSTYDADTMFDAYGPNGVTLTRWWMTYREWQNPFGGEYSPRWEFMLNVVSGGGAKSNERFSAKVQPGRWTPQYIYLKPGVSYRISAWVKTESVTGTSGTGAILYVTTPDLQQSIFSSVPVTGTTAWQQLQGTFTVSKEAMYVVGFKLTASGGNAYFDDVSIKGTTDGGSTWSGEIVGKGNFDYENYVDLQEAWKCDYILEKAKSKGVFLKTVIGEKQDPSLGSINYDGSTGAQSDSNYYANTPAGGTHEHPSRWLQKAWWRYAAARWGGYTSLHSFELCNEGDPFSGEHYNAANDFADYIHNANPRKVMCTTSFWHSIPMDFWKNSSCDYIDVHNYLGMPLPWMQSMPNVLPWVDNALGTTEDKALLPWENDTVKIEYDTATKHGGNRSLKVTGKAVSGYFTSNDLNEFHTGIDPTHKYTVKFWAKATNITVNSGVGDWVKPHVLISWSKAYHQNDWIGEASANAAVGSYDWKEFIVTGITPPATANTANIMVRTPVSLSGINQFWIDDLQFIDETTGKNLYTDGGFEADRIDIDTAMAVKKAGMMFNSYGARAKKPVVWGETGIQGPNMLGTYDTNFYKGVDYTTEWQQLADDTEGVFIKKMIWAHAGPDNPNMLYWWTTNMTMNNLWPHFKAFQAFMKGIPVSNGRYKDIAATSSNQKLRVWGQKDLLANRAYFWADNADYTWRKAVEKAAVSSVSATISFSGFTDGMYDVEWWNTTTGAISAKERVSCVNGVITLSVSNMQSDIACKIYVRQPTITVRVFIPTSELVSGNTVTVTMRYENNDTISADNYEIKRPLPLQLEYIDGTAVPANATYDSANNTISWMIPQIAPGTSGELSYRARVK